MLKKIKYGGWDNCYKLSNGIIELILTADIGPRIIWLGFIDRKNLFKEYHHQLGITDSSEWLSFGGHRFWHAPESQPRTYFPDLEPVHIQEIENGLIATQQPEPTTGLQKQIHIEISHEKPEVFLNHILYNHNLWAIEAAPWAISVMAPGGVAILPLPARGAHPDFLLPSSTLSIWPYTDLSDPRYHFGERYILIKQDEDIKNPQKLGVLAADGWTAYSYDNCVFIKQVPYQFGGVYPDLGANFEVFTNEEMLELESLGPLESIPPKGQIEHQEHWTLIDKVPQIKTEADVRNHLEKHL